MTWCQPETFGDSPIARHGHVMVVANDALYIHGGLSGHGIFNDLHALDLGERQDMSYCLISLRLWVCCMLHFGIHDYSVVFSRNPYPRLTCSLSLTTSSLLPDGIDEGLCTRISSLMLTFFHAASHHWSEVETTGDIPVARAAHSACAHSGHIIMFGGMTAMQCLGDICILDVGKRNVFC